METTDQIPVVTLHGQTITLPSMVAQQFQPEERFALLQQGDTLILKRLTTMSPVDRANATPDPAGPPSLDEIDDMVHAVRRARHEPKAE